MKHTHFSSMSDDDAASLQGGTISVGVGAFAEAIGRFAKTNTITRTLTRSTPIAEVGAGVGISLGLSLLNNLF